MNVKLVIVNINVSIILEDTSAHVIKGIEETQTIQKNVMVSNKNIVQLKHTCIFSCLGFHPVDTSDVHP